MSEPLKLRERILDTTEEVLRRFGPEKTNVVDVARALGMSHGNIYRHFPSKKALLDAVAARWIHRFSASLAGIAEDSGISAATRLRNWFDTLREAKRRKVHDEPEFFQMYHEIAKNVHEVVEAHVADLLGQLERIIRDGVEAGELSSGTDPAETAQAFLQATAAFHHPALIANRVPSDSEAHRVFEILIAGMRV